MSVETAKAKLKAKIDSQSTERLFEMLDLIGEHTASNPLAPEVLITRAAISDCIETRHNLTNAMDAIYEDVNWSGTYTEALRKALAESN